MILIQMYAKGSLDIFCHIATSHALVILSLSRPEAAVCPAKERREGRRRGEGGVNCQLFYF